MSRALTGEIDGIKIIEDSSVTESVIILSPKSVKLFERLTKNVGPNDILCPFCKDQEFEFDALGLKQHLERGWCEAWNKTEEE